MPRRASLALLCAAACLFVVPAAHADDYISSFSLAPQASAAGVHTPVDMTTQFGTDDPVRDLVIHLPAGLVGNPKAVPACPQADFAADTCDANTRVGTTSVDTTTSILGIPTSLSASGFIYNVVPNADEPARLGAIVTADIPVIGGIAKITLPVTVALRPDGGLDTTIKDIPTTAAGLPTVVKGMTLTLGDEAPDFMTTPTSCSLKTTRIDATTRADVTHSAGSTFTPTQCGAVPFSPSAALSVANPTHSAPSGYAVTLNVPDGGSPRQSHVRRASVVLPAGTVLSPGVANGLVACTTAQFGPPGAPAGCPAASQIGTVSFTTPLIGTLAGKVFFGAPANGVFPVLVAVAGHGVLVKLTGAVTLDPANGRISTVFDDLPQVPFTSFTLTFNGGDRAVLANPTTCGTKALAATLTPWSGNAARTATASFTTTGCPAGGIPFRPTLAVTSSSTAAGRTAGALSITIARPDGDQDVAKVQTDLPPGLAASLSGIPLCGEADATKGSCPASTRLGSVIAQVGTGNAPVTLQGSVFLTGPAEGGLAGLAIVLPGKVGPVDLGTVVVRAGLLLRPADGGVTVRTGTLPAFVGGVPVSVRSLTLRLDRPGFTLNPSSCALQDVVAQLTSRGNATATAHAPYQASDCAGLPYAPAFSGTIDARGPKGARHQPTLRTIITVPPANAATSSATVMLPKRLGLALPVRSVCTADQAAADACPASSQVGTVTAQTPLLPVPLSGPVYVAQVPGQLLPGLRLALGGLVQLRLTGALEFGAGGLVTKFAGIPDVPLSKLALTFTGGGPLKVTGNLPCTGSLLRATAALTGHNGASASVPSRFKVRGCPAVGRATIHRRSRAFTVDLRKGRDTRALRTVKVTLPVRASHLRATADGRRVKPRGTGRTITLRARGAKQVVLRGRLAAFTRRAIKLSATRANGKHVTLKLKPKRLR
jgi:hypothetical protein